MNLDKIVKRLEEYSSLENAHYSKLYWDNVGLLVEPSGNIFVDKILITNDLTEPILDEAIRKNVQLIIAYHPVIHEPLKRLNQTEWSQRSIVKCIENRIAVYSPHTCWDSYDGGINDWIFQAFKIDSSKTVPILPVKPNKDHLALCKTLKINLKNETEKINLQSNLKDQNESIKFVSDKDILISNMSMIECEFLANDYGCLHLMDTARNLFGSDILSSLRINDLVELPQIQKVGLGRIGHLKEEIKIKDVIEILKNHLKIKIVRVALGNGKSMEDKVKVVACGAGCGSGMLNNLENVDLIITGEFNHEEILHEVHRKITLILTDHTNTERGHHIQFREKFMKQLKSHNEYIELILSEIDRDPLEPV